MCIYFKRDTINMMLLLDSGPSQSTLPEPTPHGTLSQAACLLSDGLIQRWDKIIARLNRCRSDFNEENVHDLRVSIRRMMALLAMCRAVMPGLKSKSLRRELKAHLDSLDGMRDTQIMLLFLNRYFRKQEAAAPLVAYLNLQEAQLLRQVAYEIGMINDTLMTGMVHSLRGALEQTLTGTGVAGQILAAVDEAYADVQWRQVNVDPENPASVHALRIAFKKFRYMLEVAGTLVPPMPTSRPQALHHYQGLMGDIQDMVVFLGFIDQFAAENPQFDISAVRVFVIQKRDERLAYFLARINQLNRFWRRTPVAHFPWRSPAEAAINTLVWEAETT
jgi:CHAD domain-containing protein